MFVILTLSHVKSCVYADITLTHAEYAEANSLSNPSGVPSKQQKMAYNATNLLNYKLYCHIPV